MRAVMIGIGDAAGSCGILVVYMTGVVWVGSGRLMVRFWSLTIVTAQELLLWMQLPMRHVSCTANRHFSFPSKAGVCLRALV